MARTEFVCFGLKKIDFLWYFLMSVKGVINIFIFQTRNLGLIFDFPLSIALV
jgi:hypothetical protein